ncbi:MAG: hypothetical protein ACJAQT_002241 [Akkermansiaceae bacterium]|jgi:hypothetical protein
MKLLLLITHLLALGAGFFFFRPDHSKTASESSDTAPSPSSRRTTHTLPPEANPITQARSDDYRRALAQYFADGGDVINAERYLREWAKTDPDAALLSLAGVYEKHRVGNLLSNFVQNTGSLLGPALVRNYGELDSIAAHTVQFVIGRAIAVLAKEDLDSALDLMAQLPVPPEALPYREVMDALDGPGLKEFFEKTSGPDSALKFPDDVNYWDAAVSRAWRVFSPAEYRALFTQFDQPIALERLIQGALKEVRNFGKNEGFVDLFDSLPPAKQKIAFRVFQKSLRSISPQELAAMRETIEQRGSTALAEALDSARR